MEYRPVVVAHRGLWLWRFVENSAEAFRAAVDAGFPAECDVWKSADRQPVVIHDSTLDRTTVGHGAIGSFTALQLSQIRLRSPGIEQSSPVPGLSDVADSVHLVEIKPSDDGELVGRVIECMQGRRWLLQSFDASNLRHAARLDSTVPMALLVDDTRGIEQAINFGWDAHVNHELLDDRVVGRLQDRGLRIGAWTVNSEEQILRLMNWRVDLIISDQPHLVRRVLHQSGVQTTALDDWHPRQPA